ncbi:MAG: hypothetical protein WCE38_20000 [Burkholderiales bacterium]
MKRILAPLILLAGLLPLPALAVCFTVFDGDRIVYRDLATPVDLSQPISDAMRDKYPRGQLIIAPENDNCTLITAFTSVNIRAPAEAPAPMAPAKPAAPGPTADMGKAASAPASAASAAPTPQKSQ